MNTNKIERWTDGPKIGQQIFRLYFMCLLEIHKKHFLLSKEQTTLLLF